jgi:hypothetical protein
MRHFFAGCLLLAITLPCPAQGDKAKPNTLSAKEVADGWILLFDGETTFGWTSQNDPPKVRDGMLEFGGKKSTVARHALSLFIPSYELSCEFAIVYKGANKEEGGGGFLLEFGNGGASAHMETDMNEGKKLIWHKKTLRVIGEKGTVDTNKFDGMGLVRVSWLAEADTIVMLRNAKLRPLNTKSLFNGKDLAGWKEFPGKKSKFAVIDGAINVQTGPGDLQTVGKYKDFILQLECISNGKHLNSGIFFRCRDNEYQNGYEAQIRNQFTPEATQDYTIEEYDPKTNKLIGKNKIKSTAVDYGTGAIYRRQPARKEMAKDGEWFGMTIVAHGNHLTTWVNGVQVTDWHDNRPKSDNARTGCKLEAGHISIQGHDPTTNLSFRNFRIAELK